MAVFRRVMSYADEHPLALEVDVGDGELAGERHGCGDGCECLFFFGKVRVHLLPVFTNVESTPPKPRDLVLERHQRPDSPGSEVVHSDSGRTRGMTTAITVVQFTRE